MVLKDVSGRSDRVGAQPQAPKVILQSLLLPLCDIRIEWRVKDPNRAEGAVNVFMSVPLNVTREHRQQRRVGRRETITQFFRVVLRDVAKVVVDHERRNTIVKDTISLVVVVWQDNVRRNVNALRNVCECLENCIPFRQTRVAVFSFNRCCRIDARVHATDDTATKQPYFSMTNCCCSQSGSVPKAANT